jgi:hypothetical protein
LVVPSPGFEPSVGGVGVSVKTGAGGATWVPSGSKAENFSTSVFLSAAFMKTCQIGPAMVRPNAGRPALVRTGELSSVPTQTAVDSDGV